MEGKEFGTRRGVKEGCKTGGSTSGQGGSSLESCDVNQMPAREPERTLLLLNPSTPIQRI